MKTIKISVTDFAKPIVLTGSIDQSERLAAVDAELGSEIHHKIQVSRASVLENYRPEVSVKHSLTVHEELRVDLSGRIDGTWLDQDGGLIVEEIKTTYNLAKLIKHLDSNDEHPYLMQARLYVWILSQNASTEIKPHLLIVGAGTGREITYPVSFDLESINEWIARKLVWIDSTWADVQSFRASQAQRAKTLRFPFAKRRLGQDKLTLDVKEACKNQRHLLAQAPTGLGKTAAILIPALKATLKSRSKLFHVTPKNSQLREAEKLFVKLNKHQSPIKAMIATSKAKICMQDEPICSPELCRFAVKHYDKVNEHQLITKLRQLPLINQKILQEYATLYEVCPYELGRQVMPWMDVIAGDYHYALSPHANFRETSSLPLVKDEKQLLTIDESHNLAERAIDWYSSDVSPISTEILAMAPSSLQKTLHELNSWLSAQLKDVFKQSEPLKNLDRDGLLVLMESWNEGMPGFLEDLSGVAETNALVTTWFGWLNFARLCELPSELFFAIAHTSKPSFLSQSEPRQDTSDPRISLHCANAGPLLQEKLAPYPTVVAFSATLKPFQYHMQMTGFDPERTDTREYESPFPRSNRCIIAVPQVSTAWKDRVRSIPRIADVINRVTKLRTGNYIAFFPSFELLRQTRLHIKSETLEIFEQPNRASLHWTNGMLRSLKKRRNILLLAVQGGTLSEGIDLPREALIGAFVVGPALPMVTPEREARRRVLNELYGDGFSYAYIHPAMARSIQAAGRVVRTPTDRGLIILMDQRFISPAYANSLPRDWLEDGETPTSLVSQSILKDVAGFWGQEKT